MIIYSNCIRNLLQISQNPISIIISEIMEQTSDNENQFEPKSVEVEFQEQLIKVSSNDSSPNMDKSLTNEAEVNNIDIQPYDGRRSLILSDAIQQNQVEQPSSYQFKPLPNQEGQPKQPIDIKSSNIIEQIKMEEVIRQAEQQRIGGTFDYFRAILEKYRYHLLSRKIALTNITAMIDKNKITKAHPVIILKEYFKNYITLCSDFYQRSQKYQSPLRQQNDNKLINLSIELKSGLDGLVTLRKRTGSEISKLQKYMKTIISKIDKAAETYWILVASHQAKSTAKRQIFQEKQKKFQKRLSKIGKIYNKGIIGEQLAQDLFQQMLKFIKDERQLRVSIHDWTIQILNLRKNAMDADFTFFSEIETILSEFKTFNNTVYQFPQKKYNFLERLKENIQTNYCFQRLCTPLDSDYILHVNKLIKKCPITRLNQQDYESYFKEQYFGQLLGEDYLLIIGTIMKTFALKNDEEQLVKTISGNLVYYNKKTLEVRFKMNADNTSAQFQGNGRVVLKQKRIGIIFDSDVFQNIVFRDQNIAEEVVFFIGERYSDN